MGNTNYQCNIQTNKFIYFRGDLLKLPTLTLFIKESMRMYPPVFNINRKLTEDLEIDGAVFPAGISIGISILGMHMNKDVWGPDANASTIFLGQYSNDKY